MLSHHTEGWYDLSRILRTRTIFRKMMVASIDWYPGLIVEQDHLFVCLFVCFCFLYDIALRILSTFSIYGFCLGGKAHI